jgi:hypothetical protein
MPVSAVVLVLDVAEDDSCLEQGGSVVTVEALLPQAVVERFDVAGVPRRTGRNVVQADPSVADPLQRQENQLRPLYLITPGQTRPSPACYQSSHQQLSHLPLEPTAQPGSGQVDCGDVDAAAEEVRCDALEVALLAAHLGIGYVTVAQVW